VRSRDLVLSICVALACWHAVDVLANGWVVARESPHARDFASFYYAAAVARGGGDPYDTEALGSAGRAERTRRWVHSYFYPPPFLLAMAWALPLDLVTAYRAWFWLDEIFLWVAVAALWRWWRPLGAAAGVALLAAVAALTAVANNDQIGQMNLPVLALVALGLWAAERGREVTGGLCLGAACMAKMSPALFVAWWLLRRRWAAAGAAIAAAAGLTLVSLAAFGLDVQRTFWLDVFPAFARGDYNGLAVPIGLFGNHSIPSLWHAAFPGDRLLSATARSLSAASALGLFAGAAWMLRATRRIRFSPRPTRAWWL